MDWQNLFLTNAGRLDRQPFWIGTVVIFLISLIVRIVIHIVFGHGNSAGHVLDAIIGLILLYPPSISASNASTTATSPDGGC